MSAADMMPGASGQLVKCYRRRAANVQSGDWLPEHGAHVVGPAVEDPDDGYWWVTLDSGQDVRFTPRGKVWLHRTYAAPEWMAQALDAYRHARFAWEALRESGAVVPASLAGAGAAGTQVSAYQLEERDFRAAYPPPRLAEFIREAAAAWKESA
jgi:hypothetical protein